MRVKKTYLKGQCKTSKSYGIFEEILIINEKKAVYLAQAVARLADEGELVLEGLLRTVGETLRVAEAVIVEVLVSAG